MKSHLKLFTHTLLGTAVLAFSACSFRAGIDSIEKPDAPESFKSESLYSVADTKTSGSKEKWWQSFGDEELNALMEEALAQNLTLRARLERLRQSGFRYSIDAAEQFPSLGIAAGIDRSQQNFRAFRNTSTNVGVSAPVTYELDVFRRNYFRADAAEAELDAARFDFHASAVSIAAEVAELYFGIIELCEQKSLLLKTIRADEGFLELAESRYRDGVAAALDVHQAKQNLAANNARLPTIKRTLKENQHRLSVLLGEYPGDKLDCTEKTLPHQMAKVEVGVPTALLAERPDILAAYERLRAADARVAQAVAERFPSITLSARGGYDGEEVEKLFRPENLVWAVAADLGVTIFDAGRLAARADLQRSVFRERGIEYSLAVLQGFREVEDSLAGLYYRQNEVYRLEEKVEANQASLRVALSEYVQGVRDYLPVLLSQVSLYGARSELLSARRAMLSSQIQLVRSLGGGWSASELNSRIERDEDV